MNYKKIYYQIIQNRKQNPLSENEYGEKHHIIPKSLGGDDSDKNIIKLSAREHFICHALLAEMYERESFEWYKMNHAFMMMRSESETQNRYFNSRLYELKKHDFSKVMSESQAGKSNSQYGTLWVFSIEKLENLKIKKQDLKLYLSNGYSRGRIQNFELFFDKLQEKKLSDIKKQLKKEKRYKEVKKIYDDFINSNCNSLREYVRKTNYPTTVGSLRNLFKKWIDEYKPTHGKSYKNGSIV